MVTRFLRQFTDPARAEPEEVRRVETKVVSLALEFGQAHVQASDGTLFAITEKTPGIRLHALHEGQAVRCTVTGRLSRVLSAEVIG